MNKEEKEIFIFVIKRLLAYSIYLIFLLVIFLITFKTVVTITR